MNAYTRNGFKNRLDYLKHLSGSTGVPLEDVQTIAELLGEEEDFDGLVITLEDAVDYGLGG